MMTVSIITSMFTGIIMTFIRVREPYFKFLIRSEFKGWFGILLDENDIKKSNEYVNDSLATFLTSSINVELVHLILEAITKHTVGKTDPTVNYLSFGKEKFKEVNKFTIDTIVIKEPEKWKVAKLGEFLVAT